DFTASVRRTDYDLVEYGNRQDLVCHPGAPAETPRGQPSLCLLRFKGNAAFTKRLAHEDIKRRSQVHTQLIKKSVGLCFQIRVHADTDVCSISSHIISP